VATEEVRIWRPAREERVLLMAGQTTHYSLEPRGDYVFGVVTGQPMLARRGRRTFLVHPGQLVAWDPSAAHSGEAAQGSPWFSRLMVVEAGGLEGIAAEEEDPLTDVAFPDPVLSDPDLAARFIRLHRALESPLTALEQDEQLLDWLTAVVAHSAAPRRPRRSPARDDRALRLAGEYLVAHSAENVRLAELAAVAGVDKFSLVRLFRQRTGLPPHALQIAHRIRAARRLLEAGESIGAAAALTGFCDQSHLHRHFRRSLGMTPGQYRMRAGLAEIGQD
jgi:AraC-like DNA-binding protein